MTKTKKLICGWGINDVDYLVTRKEKVNGKRVVMWECPYYKKWRSMIQRCFSSNLHRRSPAYVGCTINPEWKYFSNFIKWVDSQPNRDWEVCELDKDLLFEGNKQYCHDTAVFVRSNVNGFIHHNHKRRGDYMIGVQYRPNKSKTNPYQVMCRDPLNKGRQYVGCFKTELEAHKAWQAKKHEYALRLADAQRDPRVAKALRERYAPDKDWTKK